jgi:hypothetical protein
MLEKGFDITPTDGSAELARQAEKLIGRPVMVMRFQDLQATDEFDGVWAEASLLHVPRAELPDVFAGIHSALKPGAPNPYIDAQGYQDEVTIQETAFNNELQRQQKEGPPPPRGGGAGRGAGAPPTPTPN